MEFSTNHPIIYVLVGLDCANRAVEFYIRLMKML